MLMEENKNIPVREGSVPKEIVFHEGAGSKRV
jgi:hypothetical protein